jgi:S-ribosylhomocysteine lyase LuxS involved in autoinducer biosynthesis
MGLIKSRTARWVGLVACMGKRRGFYAIVVGKPEGKRLLLTLRLRWEDDIKMDERMKGRGLH